MSDAETVEVAKMVLVGKVNKDIVLRLNRHGQPAVGLCGDDGLLFRVARQAGAGRRGHRLRRAIERVDADVLTHVARGLHPGDRVGRRRPRGHSYNVNADEAAGAVARALGAYKVMFLTDVAGWLRDPADPDSRDLRGERRRGRGGAARRSTAGCGRSSRPASTRSTAASRFAHIIDGRVPHSLLLELFTDAGIGTKIRPARMSLARAAGARGART